MSKEMSGYRDSRPSLSPRPAGCFVVHGTKQIQTAFREAGLLNSCALASGHRCQRRIAAAAGRTTEEYQRRDDFGDPRSATGPVTRVAGGSPSGCDFTPRAGLPKISQDRFTGAAQTGAGKILANGSSRRRLRFPEPPRFTPRSSRVFATLGFPRRASWPFQCIPPELPAARPPRMIPPLANRANPASPCGSQGRSEPYALASGGLVMDA